MQGSISRKRPKNDNNVYYSYCFEFANFEKNLYLIHMTLENDKRTAYLLKTLECYSQLTEYAEKAFEIKCQFPINLNDFSAMIIANSKK